MRSSLQAYLDAQQVPLHVRRRLRDARLVVDSAEIEHLTDQLAVRLTLAWQDVCPALLVHDAPGIVLAGMLMRRLGFALTFDTLYVEEAASGVHDGQMAIVVAGSLEHLEPRQLSEQLQDRGAAGVVLVTLLPDSRADDSVLPAERIDTSLVTPVGCGFDIDGFGANLPHLYSCR